MGPLAKHGLGRFATRRRPARIQKGPGEGTPELRPRELDLYGRRNGLYLMEFIYTLTNRVTGSIYVGKTTDPSRRYCHHIYMLSKGISHHPKLQADFNTYGDVYAFQVVDMQLESDSIDRESLWISKIDCKYSLNIQKRSGNAKRANERLKSIRVGLE